MNGDEELSGLFFLDPKHFLLRFRFRWCLEELDNSSSELSDSRMEGSEGKTNGLGN